MKQSEVETVELLGKVIMGLPSNVVETPMGGNMRTFKPPAERVSRNARRTAGVRAPTDVADFFSTALAATRATEIGTDPLKQLDSDLLKGKSGGLARLKVATETAAKKEKFKPKVVKETPEKVSGLKQISRLVQVAEGTNA